MNLRVGDFLLAKIKSAVDEIIWKRFQCVFSRLIQPASEISDPTMEVTTSRFGTINISSSDTICFPNGVAGFEDGRDWVLLIERPGRTVGWLQSTYWPEVAFPVVDPRRFVPDYTLRLTYADWSPLGADRRSRIQLLVTVAIHNARLTLNLMAPIAINQRRRLGRQVINNGSWPIDHVVLDATSSLRKVA